MRSPAIFEVQFARVDRVDPAMHPDYISPGLGTTQRTEEAGTREVRRRSRKSTRRSTRSKKRLSI